MAAAVHPQRTRPRPIERVGIAGHGAGAIALVVGPAWPEILKRADAAEAEAFHVKADRAVWVALAGRGRVAEARNQDIADLDVCRRRWLGVLGTRCQEKLNLGRLAGGNVEYFLAARSFSSHRGGCVIGLVPQFPRILPPDAPHTGRFA